jgi:metal-sulfur cluster biosynthetic enzyme
LNAEGPTQEEVSSALKTVMDPEIGLNIVDLGLIYDIRIDGRNVALTFTLTSPGCPMQYVMAAGIRQAVLALEAVEDCEVKLVWDPPWTPSLISPEGRAQLDSMA